MSETPGDTVTEPVEYRVAELEAEAAVAAADLAHGWEVEKLQVEHERAIARLTIEAANAATEAERQTEQTLVGELHKAQQEADATLNHDFHAAVIEVTKGSLDRSREGAKWLQGSATAILGIYTALLALVFSVTDNPLPIRGVYAGIFLGLAIAFSTAYISFHQKPAPVTVNLPAPSVTQLQFARTAHFTQWMYSAVSNKRSWIRASVLSLTVGVAFIAAPFITADTAASIPESPVAPEIPSAIDPAVAESAAALFEQQVADYTTSVEARKEAIAGAEIAIADTQTNESNLNDTALGVAIAALILIGIFTGFLAFLDRRQQA